MGLDTVEIVLEIEEAFGIHIPDEVAANLLTLQDVTDYVTGQVTTIPQETCKTQQIYYRLRRGFRSQIPALAGDLDLRMALKDVLHRDQWSRVWTAVRKQVGEDYWPEDIPWPRLLAPGPVTVKDLVYYVAFALPKPNVEQADPWTRERIALQVRDIVKDYTRDVSFKRTARFVKDLGID
jgi:hypothetical protein